MHVCCANLVSVRRDENNHMKAERIRCIRERVHRPGLETAFVAQLAERCNRLLFAGVHWSGSILTEGLQKSCIFCNYMVSFEISSYFFLIYNIFSLVKYIHQINTKFRCLLENSCTTQPILIEDFNALYSIVF